MLKPLVDPAPGGGLLIFWSSLAAIRRDSGAWAVWGPDRGIPDGASEAILDLRLAFATRIAIHLVFLAALLVLGFAAERCRFSLIVALAILGLEVPLRPGASSFTHHGAAVPLP